MYIPTMGFITYILLAGWSMGSAGEFDPARLGEVASAATGWVVLEVFLTLFALFLLQASPIQFYYVIKVRFITTLFRLILR